jgi:hypothetical protein
MRWKLLAAAAVLVVSLAVTVVACSSKPACTAGTMVLDVALYQTAPLADTITIQSTTPNIAVSPTSVPHTPDPMAPGVEHTTLILTFPNGYPNDKVVNLVVKAIGGVTVLGANTATLHTSPSCTVGAVDLIGGDLPTADLGQTD